MRRKRVAIQRHERILLAELRLGPLRRERPQEGEARGLRSSPSKSAATTDLVDVSRDDHARAHGFIKDDDALLEDRVAHVRRLVAGADTLRLEGGGARMMGGG